MDANEERLPDEEIIFTSLALASTIPVFRNQVQYYLRRKITVDCKCNKKGVIGLKVRRDFKNYKVSSPPGKRGRSQTVSGKEAFLGVLEEFGKELGPHGNLKELKEDYHDLPWEDLEETWENPTSGRLFELYGIKIRWQITLIESEDDSIRELKMWERNAETKRAKFDKHPHPVEILWREKKEDIILKEIEKKYLDRLLKKVDEVIIIKPGRHGLEARSEELTKVFVELKVTEGYSRNKDLTRLDEEEETARRTFKPEELIETVRQGIITGAPGCGKTTLLKYLARKVLEDGKFLPVFLEAKVITEEAFRGAKEDLKELLFNLAIARHIHLEGWEKENFKSHFFKRLAEGKVFIFLDGLDEIPEEGFSKRLRLAIEEFLKSEYGQKTGLLLSTGPYALTTFGELKLLEVLPFNEGQIEKFIRHYYGDLPNVDGLLKELKEVKGVKLLAESPFILSIVVSNYWEKGKIETNKLALYEDLVNRLLVELHEKK